MVGADLMISAYIQVGTYETSKIDDEFIVFNKEKETVTRLNTIGSYCWSLLAEIQSIDSLMKEIEKHFEVELSSENIRAEIEDFIFDLYRFGLIRHVD
jgi:hypothetical protein